MGIDSLLQQDTQNAGLAGTDRLARNAMFPQSQMDKTQYAVSSQMPTGAETIRADYDAPTNAYTGLPTQPFANGGIAALRYDDGGQILNPEDMPAPAATEPSAPPTMAELADQLNTAYRTNSNYDQLWKDFEATKAQDPAEWYRKQLGFLGGQQGWQIGQNTGERGNALNPQIQDTVAQAQAAGLSPDEINQILAGSNQSANYANQQRIAQEGASGGMFNGISGLAVPAATMLALGTGNAWALPLINGGISALQGTDPTKIATTAALSAIPGLNLAKNLYGAVQSGGQDIGADVGIAKGALNLAGAMASGGVAHGGDGIANLGSYSDGGRLLKGPGDGMSDHIPATIGGKQPARLAEGEFVVPADVVSHLGNGSTDAGAKQLYKMMDNIRKARTGNPKQGKQINPAKFLPKG